MNVSLEDSLQRFVLENVPVRGAVVHLDKSLSQVLSHVSYPPVVSAALTEAMVSSLLMSGIIKWTGRFVLQCQSDGPLRLLVVRVTHDRDLCAMARWNDPLPETSDALLSSGHVVTSVVHDNFQPTYQSVVPLNAHGLVASLQDYFHRSEQLPTHLWVMSDGTKAHGLMLQALPDQEGAFDFSAFIASLDENGIDFTQSNEQWMPAFFSQHDCRLFDSEAVRFRCGCNLEKMQQAVVSMGEKEARSVLATHASLEVRCDFCQNTYAFSASDIDEIFSAQDKHP